MIDIAFVNCVNCKKSNIEIIDPRQDQHGKIVRTWEDIPPEDRFEGEVTYWDLCVNCEDLCYSFMPKKERQLSFMREIGVIK